MTRFRAPRFGQLFPRPFNRQWSLDVSLTNDSSFLFPDAVCGEILAEVRLTGTLEYPLLLDKSS